jgi:hypothetical protein
MAPLILLFTAKAPNTAMPDTAIRPNVKQAQITQRKNKKGWRLANIRDLFL